MEASKDVYGIFRRTVKLKKKGGMFKMNNKFQNGLRYVIAGIFGFAGALATLGGTIGLLKSTSSALAWSSSMQVQFYVIVVGFVLLAAALAVAGVWNKRE